MAFDVSPKRDLPDHRVLVHFLQQVKAVTSMTAMQPVWLDEKSLTSDHAAEHEPFGDPL